MRYCARWRMRVAANMLRDGKQNTSTSPIAVGFNSEAAFTALKREYGEPPATWRRRIERRRKASGELGGPELPEQEVRYSDGEGTRLAYSVVGKGRRW